MSSKMLSFAILLTVLVIFMTKSAHGINIPESLLSDPRFINCMEETSGPEDSNYMAVFARCYSFAGRPRFGKRGSDYKDIAALFKHYRMVREQQQD